MQSNCSALQLRMVSKLMCSQHNCVRCFVPVRKMSRWQRRHLKPVTAAELQKSSDEHEVEKSQLCPSRRIAAQALLTAAFALHGLPGLAVEESNSGARGLSRYIKKKKLDPIDTYLPTVLQARKQLLKAGTVMKQNATDARTLLRKGSFSGLRDTVKALGEFATEAGMPQQKAGQLVNNFLSSLQKLDNTLISSLRSKTPVPDAADKEVEQAVQDLDRLLATAPAQEIEKAQKLLDEVKAMFAEPPKSDKDVQALQQLIPRI